MNFIGIIPARFASSRFPGKPLADIHGKPMIRHVYERAGKALEHVWVATDDQRIFDAVRKFGGNVVYTSPLHKSGTDRVAEAARIIEEEVDFDVVVNIQGDEPFIDELQIEKIKNCFENDPDIVTPVRPARSEEEICDANKPKVVVRFNGEALYFSRSPIPFIQGTEKNEWLGRHDFYIHVGLYAYKKAILQEITALKAGKLEIAESLEQLRWLENGYKILTVEIDYEGFGIDTPEDLKRALQLFL